MSPRLPSIVAYDIADDRSRLAVANRLLSIGVRLQDSVFEVLVRKPDALLEELLAMVDPAVDRIEIIAQCRACRRGRRRHPPGPGVLEKHFWLT